MLEAGRSTASGRALAESKLYEGRDLAVTTDFRDVFAEVLAKRLGVADLKPVFPGYPIDEKKRLDVIV